MMTMTTLARYSFKTTTTVSRPLIRDTRVGRYQKKQLLWIFMEQGRIMEAEAPTVRVGTTPTRLMAPLSPQPPPKVFYRSDALPAAQPTVSKHWRYKLYKRPGTLWAAPCGHCKCRQQSVVETWPQLASDTAELATRLNRHVNHRIKQIHYTQYY